MKILLLPGFRGRATNQRYHIHELAEFSVEGGYLIDGFPSTGHTSAIASASLINAMRFTPVATLDSDRFPPVSMVQDSRPYHPTRIFADSRLKVAVFSSYLALPSQEHKPMARMMLKWARDRKVEWIVSSVAVGTQIPEGKIMAVGSTEEARKKIAGASMEVMGSGMITGIPGALLNHGAIGGQNVIVVLYNPTHEGADYRAGALLCTAMSRLVPGTACDIDSLQAEAEKAERAMREAETESGEGVLKRGMYG